LKLFECQHCGQPLYFENILCESCGRALGYLPTVETITALEQGRRGFRALAERRGRYRYCANAQHGVCNWIVSNESPEQFCAACRHNRTIPDLSRPDNPINWRRMELAKHRLFYTLLKLRLPLTTKTEDPEHGLAFDFLAAPPPGDAATEPVVTGHSNGLITINLSEADDSQRERMRRSMGEPYRTLLGHFRHEIAHYYWNPLVADSPGIEEFRALFGDEREDYGAALQRHYNNGPPPDWQERFVTAYASTHPWEDWAETWAHYFHMVDTLETASAFGMRLRPRVTKGAELATAMDFDPHHATIERIIDSWLPLTFAVNSINRSMGIADLYPFVLAPPAIVKLGFIHDRIRASNGGGAADGRGTLRAVIAGLKRAVGSPEPF
jgi:hypothetical protein